MQQQTRGVTPASDVNGQAKVKNNMGIVAAAGVVPGARLGRPGDVIDGEDAMGCSGSSSRQPIVRTSKNAVARERASRSGRFRPANRLQGSNLFVRMLTGGAGHFLLPDAKPQSRDGRKHWRRIRRASGARGDDERADGHFC